MELEFYVCRLRDKHGLNVIVIVPDEMHRSEVHRVIYQELVHGKVLDSSRQTYRAVIDRLVASGAQGLIFGCTEISMLIAPEPLSRPCFDTAALHVNAAVQFCSCD